ncbi:MAG: PIN domain-containing protein [Candidatus Parabeggiatoa sp.]
MITKSLGISNVLVDACIWSFLLRRRDASLESLEKQTLLKLIQQTRVILLGVVRQEVLSGIRETHTFERIRQKLRSFPDFPLTTEDYEKAAEFYNICRSKGVQGSSTDFLLCAVSHRYDFPIFTTDKDFEHFQKYLDFQLYSVEVKQCSVK